MAGSATLQVPREALDLNEGISLLEAASSGALTKPDGTIIELGYDANGQLKEGGLFDAQGRVPLHIIRPGIGRGRGRHLYEAQMLQEAAGTFAGWKMYVNHQSPEAKKAAGGLPRDVRDLGGRVQESWWDPSVPADDAKGHGQGSVMGMVRPVKFIRELIDDDPALVESSIAASATGVRPVTRDGERVWLVEGIGPRGSVDWVTEAGAGGKIASVLEEAYADEKEVEMALIESMTDDEVRQHIEASRPGLLLQEAAKKDADGDDDSSPEGEDDGLKKKVAEMVKKGMPQAMAEKAAKRALSESNADNPEGGDMAEITPEALIEALTQSGEVQVFLSSLVEAKLSEERETLRAENRADVDRAFALARFERTAHEMIAESKLPESWQADLKARFALVENEPTDELNVLDETDAEGAVVKPAIEVLRESVTAEIEKQQTRLREASTTRVRSTPVVALTEAAAEQEKDGEKPPAAKGDQPYWAQILSEAGVSNPDEAYAPITG